MTDPLAPSLSGFAGRPSSASGRGEASAGRLADNIVHFARALRAAGLPVGPGAVLDALQAVQTAGVGTKDDFYWTLHAVFVKRHEQSIIFEQAFRIFFRKRGYLDQLMAMLLPQAPGAPAAPPPPAATRVQDALFAEMKDKLKPEEREIELDTTYTVSDRELLQKKDFAQMTAEEIAAARLAIARMVLSLDEVKTRRLTPDRRGHVIDMRRTLRASMKAGGAFIDLKYLGVKTKLPPIVALLDISGSMSDYTRLFLHFLHAVTDARKRVHTFLFGTRLTNVTRALKARDPDEALSACSASVLDWSGGTRIATSLHVFNKQWARRMLGHGAIVLLITDGLERDPDDRLAFEIDRLHRSCRRLIWLNPLLRFEGFEAKAKGIQTILPHVDEFRPIHNLESMAELTRALSAQGGRRGHLGDPKEWLRRVA
ncbi:MAG TPA: VWA domain-containing protein [Xanthobacteraceae bacterium]|nr:VWA domain-containing protein [Xanthobacteraceae bacterium]